MSITPVQKAQLSAGSTQLEDNLIAASAASQIAAQRALEKTVGRFQKYQETAEANLVAIQEENALLRQRIASLEAERQLEVRALREAVCARVCGVRVDLGHDIAAEEARARQGFAILNRARIGEASDLPVCLVQRSRFDLDYVRNLERRIAAIETDLQQLNSG